MKSIIVAVDKNMGIGADNGLLWGRDLPDDLAYFKKMTLNSSVIMGRNTFESLGRALPERENIVVTHSPVGVTNVLSAASLASAYELARYPIFVIGGGQIYASAMNDMDRLYVTEVDAEFPEATVFFPAVNLEEWSEKSREHHEADDRNKYSFDFVIYEKTNDD